MNILRDWRESERAAVEVLIDYSQQTPISFPIPVENLVESLFPLTVEYDDLDPNISGEIDLGRSVIRINKKESYERQRFSLGHELGHYILHRTYLPLVPCPKGLFGDFESFHSSLLLPPSRTRDWWEVEANKFAAALLAPRHLLKPEVERLKSQYDPRTMKGLMRIVRELAKKAEISISAMTYRLKNTGFLSLLWMNRLLYRDIFFDLETQDLGSHSRLAIAVTWNPEDGFRIWMERDARDLVVELDSFQQIIGFNLLSFDYPVLERYYPGISSMLSLKTVDLMFKVIQRTGYRISLDALSEATLRRYRLDSARDVPILFQMGKIDKVIEHCKTDVELIRDLYYFGIERGFLYYFKDGYKVCIPFP